MCCGGRCYQLLWLRAQSQSPGQSVRGGGAGLAKFADAAAAGGGGGGSGGGCGGGSAPSATSLLPHGSVPTTIFGALTAGKAQAAGGGGGGGGSGGGAAGTSTPVGTPVAGRRTAPEGGGAPPLALPPSQHSLLSIPDEEEWGGTRDAPTLSESLVSHALMTRQVRP